MTIRPDSPCEATVTPGDNGGVTVDVFVPTYMGGATFTIHAERDNDGDWRVFIPWAAELSDKPVLLTDGHEACNGILYLGAPDVERERTDDT